MKDAKSFLRVLGVFIVFVLVFVILINKQKTDSFGDIASQDFNVKTVFNKQLVARDTSSIYPRYFVFYFNKLDGSYIVHSYNYYDTESQYELEFNRHLPKIVDYDYNKYMIRYVYDEGYGNFDEVYSNIQSILDVREVEIYD